MNITEEIRESVSKDVLVCRVNWIKLLEYAEQLERELAVAKLALSAMGES